MTETDLRGHEFIADGLHHNILQLLFGEAMTSESLYAALPTKAKRFVSLPELVTDVTSVMVADGYLEYDRPLWRITDRGIGMLNFVNHKAAPPKVLSVAGKKEYTVPAGIYNGAELRDTCLRKGAYDFLALPSVYGDTHVPHRTAAAFLGSEHERDI